MYIFRGKEAFHQDAVALITALERQGLTIERDEALGALALLAGFESYEALGAQLRPSHLDAALAPAERSHVLSTIGISYGPEVVLYGPRGFALRAPAYAAECDYLRVTDQLGRETAFWTSSEWREEPEGVIGAVLGAVVRGNANYAVPLPTPDAEQAEIPGSSSDPLYRVAVTVDTTMSRSILVRAPNREKAAELACDYAHRTGGEYFEADAEACWSPADYYIGDRTYGIEPVDEAHGDGRGAPGGPPDPVVPTVEIVDLGGNMPTIVNRLPDADLDHDQDL